MDFGFPVSILLVGKVVVACRTAGFSKRYEQRGSPDVTWVTILTPDWATWHFKSRQILGVQKISALISLNLPKKFSGNLCANISCHADHEHFLLEWPPKEIMWFCIRWVPFLPIFSGCLSRISGILRTFTYILPRLSRISPGFSGFLPRFSTNQTFGGALPPPAPPSPTPLVENNILGKL